MKISEKAIVQYQNKMLFDRAVRKNELCIKIDHARSEVHRLRVKSAQDPSSADHSSAQQAFQQAGQNLENIRFWQKTIRDIDIEMKIISGDKPLTEIDFNALKVEHAQALREFHELLGATGALVAAAKRLIKACKSMRLDPPTIAVQIAKWG